MSENKTIQTLAVEGVDLKKGLIYSADAMSTDAILDKYEQYKEAEKEFMYTFSMCTSKGILYGYENEVQIRMDKSAYQTRDFGVMVTDQPKAGAHMYLRVSEVDRTHNIVYVLPVVGNEEERQKVIEALKERVKKKELMRVPATVVGFTGRDPQTNQPDKSVVLLDIANLGIIGAIRRTEWGVTKLKMPSHSTFVGDVFDVVVQDISVWGKRTKRNIFDCSRRLVMLEDGIDPWVGIEQKVPRRTEVELICVDMRENSFFGVVNGLKDIEVLCDYPENIEIIVGKKYRGYINRVSEESRRLCARITDVVE